MHIMDLTPEQWTEVEALFHRVQAVPPDSRDTLIEESGVEETVRSAVRRLTMQDAAPDPLLDEGIGPSAARLLLPDADGRLPSQSFGPYRVLEVLGRGGMGVVYLAERADIGARVALKVLWDAPLSPSLRARFEEEQRIISQLRHPGIVPLYHAGQTEEGTPWFAMEYVDGQPIDLHARDRLSFVRQRLLLFREVCLAVRAAHWRLVVHGDLKPSNILVSRDGHVRLLDFGIARRLDDALPITQGRLLTPAYASPQRRAGAPVDVQSDVYSLGVILFQLLADRLPADQGERVSSMSPLRRRFGGREEDWIDIDAIIACATAPDVVQRYESVDALVRDVDRLFDGFPLEAVSVSATHRARKFLRRRRVPLVIGAASTLVALFALFAHDRSLRGARDAAIAESARTARLMQFMERLFDGGGQPPETVDSIRVATIVANGVREAYALTSDPQAQVDLLESLGVVSGRMGRYDRADTLIREALHRADTLYGGSDPRTLGVRVQRAKILSLRKQTDSAERELRSISTLIADGDRDHPVATAAQLALGVLLRDQGRTKDAMPYLQGALMRSEQTDTMSSLFVEVLRELGIAVAMSGDFAAADSVWERALPVARRIFGPKHPEVAFLLGNLGNVASQRGELAQAEQYQREAVALTSAWYGTDHMYTALTEFVLAQTLNRANRPAEARDLLLHTIDVYSRTNELGPDDANTAIAYGTMGVSLSALGDPRGARALHERAARLLRAARGPDTKSALIEDSNIASTLLAEGRADTAIALLRSTVARTSASMGERNVTTAQMRVRLAAALLKVKRYRETVDVSTDAIAIMDSVMGGRKPASRQARENLLAAYVALGDSVSATKVRAELAGIR